MEFQVLGALAFGDEQRSAVVAGRRRQLLLAALLVDANRTISVDRLVDAVWGARPPATAVSQIRDQVHRLRRTLAGWQHPLGPESVLATVGGGYRLTVAEGGTDLDRCTAIASAGRAALAAGSPEDAARKFTDALRMWRDRPFAGLDADWLRHEVEQLLERRTDLQEDLLEAQLRGGRYAEVISAAGRLVLAHPLRERLRGQLITALAATGSIAEALRAYESARRLLAAELGIEPSAALQQLYRCLLDGTFKLPAAPVRVPVAAKVGTETTSATAAHQRSGYEIEVVLPDRAAGMAAPDEMPRPTGTVLRAVPLIALVDTDEDHIAAIGDVRILTQPDAPARLVFVMRGLWAGARQPGGGAAGWRPVGGHPHVARLVDGYTSMPAEHPAEAHWLATSIAKVFAEVSRNALGRIRAERHRLAHSTSGYLRIGSLPPPVVLADLIELSTFCEYARDEARDAARTGMWGGRRTDLVALQAARAGPAIPVGGAAGRDCPWLATLDAGLRHCQAADRLAGEEIGQLRSLLAAATVSTAQVAPRPGPLPREGTAPAQSSSPTRTDPTPEG